MDLDAIRRDFPVSAQLIYFNHAAVSPISLPARRAMEAHLADVTESGALHWQEWRAALERVRGGVARLLGAQPLEIAFTKNTSEGLATVAQGLDWRPGERIVSFECEFPANLYPWLALRTRGVQVDLLPESALLDPDRLRRACQGARLLSVSFVQYLSGLRADCAMLGRICRETGTLLLVDGIQGLGAFPLDVKACGIHACAADGHKWLTGPEGAGFLYLDDAILGQLTPREVGWLNFAAWEDYSAAQRAASSDGSALAWRAGAARFECGTLNTLGLMGLRAAIERLHSTGIAAMAEHILDLGDRLGAGLRARGCALLRPSEERKWRSGITSFRHPTVAAEAVVARLQNAGVICAARNGWVRCSPHFYNTPEEVDLVCAALP